MPSHHSKRPNSVIEHGWEQVHHTSKQPGPSPELSGAWEIGLHTALLIVPMLAFSGVLLGLVFYYRVDQTSDHLDGLYQHYASGDDGAYYVCLVLNLWEAVLK
jgi:hypothetical protein